MRTGYCTCVYAAGVGLSHFTGEVKRLLGVITKYDQDNYPEMLGHICIINAPWVFRTIWPVVKALLDPRTQQKIEVRDGVSASYHRQWQR